MSVIRMVTRQIAVGALRGRTWAGQRVYDSNNTPLAEALTVGGEPRPYVVVFTDTDSRTGIDGTDLYNTNRELALTLEIGVASAIEVEASNGEKVVTVRVPLTDPGMEAAVDMTEAQAMRALFGDPQNPWCQLLLRIVNVVRRAPSQRGARGERGSRWAARQISFVCDVLDDTPAGVVFGEDHVVRAFIALALANPQVKLTDAATMLSNIILAKGYPDWEQQQAWLGLSKQSFRRLEIAPTVDIGEPDHVALIDDTGTDIVLPVTRELSELEEMTVVDEDESTSITIVEEE